jgi:hypothetical protein
LLPNMVDARLTMRGRLLGSPETLQQSLWATSDG